MILARMGPTTTEQPPFCWSQFDDKHNKRGIHFFHMGAPECFNFEWQPMPPLSMFSPTLTPTLGPIRSNA